MTGQSGKFLTNNGSAASWGTVATGITSCSRVTGSVGYLGTSTATCSSGHLTGGGCLYTGAYANTVNSYPISSSQWRCEVLDQPNTSVTAYAVCCQ
jgi:hypothetical protein